MTRWGPLVIAATLAACAHEAPRPAPAPPPKLPEARGRHVTASPPDWYWEPVFPDVPPDLPPKTIDLPAPDEIIVRVEGANRTWDELGDPGRERVRRDGIVVLGDPPGDPTRWHVGAFYNEWRDKRVPYVVTVDALFSFVHLSLMRALAGIEQRELGPLLDGLLGRIDARLTAESKGAPMELVGGYRLARSVVAVARLLANDAYVPAPEIATVVRDEKQKIDAHAGMAPSPLLGVTIDYARFAGETKGSGRAMTWLDAAPFALVARTEAKGATLDVGTVRHHARAAMLLARLADRDVDPAINASFARLTKFFTFVWGAPDDITPLGLGDLADAGGVDLAKAENLTNVVRVDKVRSLARAWRAPTLWDGSGGTAAGGVGMRLLGSTAAIDSIALGTFATPAKPLPSTLDLASWLGAPDAKADASQIHASVHGSFIDALRAWAPSPAPAKANKPIDRARLESVLASWTMVRHIASSFGRAKPAPPPPAGPRVIRVSGAALPAFVEAEPETIARLLGTVRQARRGLATLGPIAKGGPSDVLLAETEDIIKVTLRSAERTARDETLGADDASALAAIPSRMLALENDAADEGGPWGAVVHTDPAAGRALVSATGAVEPAIMLVREPGTGKVLLAAGAHLTHFEAVERTDAAEGAAALLERKIKEGKAARASWVEAFRLAR